MGRTIKWLMIRFEYWEAKNGRVVMWSHRRLLKIFLRDNTEYSWCVEQILQQIPFVFAHDDEYKVQLGLRPFSPLPISHSILYSNHSWKIVEFAFIFPPLLLRLFLSTAHSFILAKIANSVATPFLLLLLLPSLLIGHSLLLSLLPSSYSNASIIHCSPFCHIWQCFCKNTQDMRPIGERDGWIHSTQDWPN